MSIPSALLIFARELRQNQTDAESLLWHLLRDRRFCGFKFRRQVPISGYILDFYCHAAKLVIELDGGGHNSATYRLYDEERTKKLKSSGMRVLRFWNNEVLASLEDVLIEIHQHLMDEKIDG